MNGSFMKTTILYLMAGLTMSVCNKNEAYGKEGEILVTMTTAAGKIKIALAGSGTATVNWGDGKSETSAIPARDDKRWAVMYIEHTYAAPSDSHTVTITGTDITRLKCYYNEDDKNGNLVTMSNQLTALDVSKNTALTELSCYNNQLTVLDVSKNTALTELFCSDNQLTALDVSKNTALRYLYCTNNQLTALDVSKNTALTYLFCDDNQLTALDVSKNTALTVLSCSNNQLTALNVSKSTVLRDFSCNNNQLTALDVSKNTALLSLNCKSNQLSADALNALFRTLHGNTIPIWSKEIHIYNNPGVAGCDKTIAEQRGWEEVVDEPVNP